MRTLIYEPDAAQARVQAALMGGDGVHVDVARSLVQARLMLLNAAYDRLVLRRGNGAARALLAAARASNPDCVLIDLRSMRSRPVSGPSLDPAVLNPAK
jgi:CheY-like chemotaxis protein